MVVHQQGGGNSDIAVRKIDVTSSVITLGLAEQQTYQITPTIIPSNAINKEVKYSSQDTSIATVSSGGLITPIKEGVTEVTVVSVANPSVKKVIVVNVIVSNPYGNISNDINIKWDNLPLYSVTGDTQVFNEELPTPDTPINPDNILALIGSYRIAYMTITSPDGSKVVDNIVGTGNNMRGEIHVNATSCNQHPVSCPASLTIKMQYKSQFHPDIVSQGIPDSIEFIRKDIYSPLSSLSDIDGEFAKLGAEIVEDKDNAGEYVVKFTLKSPDLPMPQGYTMQVTLKKIADDSLFDPLGIVLDNTRYFSQSSNGPIKVTGVTITNKNIGIEVGKTARLSYSITPYDAENKDVIYATYNDKIASIDTNGIITAVGVGTTEVSVKTVDGGYEDKAIVNVVDKVVDVEDIEATDTNITLDINQDPSKANKTADIKFNVTPNNATYKNILLKDGYDKTLIDAKIVNGTDGVATLQISAKLNTGSTTVTVYSENYENIEKSVNVVVSDTTIHPTSVSLNKNSLKMTVGNVEQLVATVTPNNAYNQNIAWSSSNVSVAKVDDKGSITAISAGSAIITATTVDGNKQATCNITVENKYVAVESVSFTSNKATFPQNATNISVVANISPSDATNKGIKYTSSDTSKVEVNEITGALTIKDTNATSDYDVIITATSVDGNKQATITVTITSNFVPVTNVSINNKTFTELKMGATYTPSYTVTPSNATNDNVIITDNGNGIFSYDANTKTFTAVKAGTATITVKSESNQDKLDTFQITVWEPANITGKYNVTSLEIHYNGKVVKSSEAIEDGYKYDEKYFAVSTANNQLNISGKMQLVWNQFIQNPEFDVFRYRYFTHSQSLSDRENSIDKLSAKGFTFNSDGSLTYEFPFTVGEQDTLTYSAGSQNKLVLKLNNKANYVAIPAGKLRHLTPVNFADPYTIMGTYDMLTFENINDAKVTTISVGAKYSYNKGSIFKKDLVNSLTRLIGEITAVVDTTAKTINMQSKIQMNSEQLKAGAVGQNTADQQFQNTTYDIATYNLDDIATNGFGEDNKQTKGKVTMNNEVWENQSSDIRIYSNFKDPIAGIADVTVNVYGKKKSDDVITLDPNMPYYCDDYFYLPDSAKANCPISNEPTGKGYVTQLWK